MSRCVTCLCVCLAAIVGIVIGSLLPTTLAQKAEPPAQVGRYAAGVQPVLGGIGGLAIDVTDHQTNTLYLYVAQTEWGKENEGEGEPPPFELKGKVDLTSAGQARLKVDFPKEKKEKKEK
jgi:hypothetical protein